ncbi:MAG: alcohol dehydrogenase catalytic domain-containing protein, partial [Chitinivibrionales bacterium]|nr:alcohol dehydrogenase catalytic domain-containing protein [Chitinivibrionales bacterium]MBD3357748.1 alcohol dehydrogenase catalytic domain-containing protein [Chitinivibrionales bacterium]
VEEPTPDPKSGEVVVSVKSVGVCGSDVHYYKQGRIGTQRAVYPQPLGHECAGVVERTGTVNRLREGVRVAVEPGQSCRTCEHCLAGYHNRCPEVKFLASPGMPGAFADALLVREEQLVPLPENMSYDEGAMMEPLGVGYHAVCLSEMKPGNTVAVWGTGPIGLVTAAVARAAGAGEIFMFDRLQYRLDFASRTYAVDHAVNIESSAPLEYLMDHTHGRGTDISFEAAGEQESFNNAAASARIGGRVLIIGIPEVDMLSIDPHGMRKRELLVQNVRRSNHALAPCIDLVGRGTVDISGLATHHFNLNQIDQAFSTVESYGDGVLRAMIVNGE